MGFSVLRFLLRKFFRFPNSFLISSPPLNRLSPRVLLTGVVVSAGGVWISGMVVVVVVVVVVVLVVVVLVVVISSSLVRLNWSDEMEDCCGV